MTLTYVTTNLTTKQMLDEQDETLIVGPTGSIVVNAGGAIAFTKSGSEAVINGVVATDSMSIAIRTEAVTDLVQVRIGTSGFVSGMDGIRLSGNNNTVVNDGVISAFGAGVSMFGDSAALLNNGSIQGFVGLDGAKVSLANSGLIAYASNYAAAAMTSNNGHVENTGQITNALGDGLLLLNKAETGSTGYMDIVNGGTIAGAARAIRVDESQGQVTVHIANHGTLAGAVELGSGNDLYDGHLGKVLGPIAMGGGNDTTLGGVGNESIDGGSGDDYVEGNDGADAVFGGIGADTLNGGNGADTIMGGDDDDEVDAGDGNDLVFGDAGADFLGGGLGVDTLSYSLSNAGVKVNLATGEASGGFAQGDEFYGFERLVGSNFNDTLTGAAGANTIRGGDGDDILRGGDGADQLRGGVGADTIEGGTGRDVMFGGDGADRFLFRTLADSKVDPTGRDVIRDFQVGVDKIDLSLLDANAGVAGNQAFAFLTTEGAAFTAAGQLRFEHVDGNTLVQGNVNASLGADFSILLTGTLNLAASDFVL